MKTCQVQCEILMGLCIFLVLALFLLRGRYFGCVKRCFTWFYFEGGRVIALKLQIFERVKGQIMMINPSLTEKPRDKE